MGGLASLTVLGLGAVLVTFALNIVNGWSLSDVCIGTEAFCAGAVWTAVAQYLPIWLFFGQVLVVMVLASPFAFARTGR